MRNHLLTKFIVAVFSLSSLMLAGTAFASTPSLYATSSGNSVTLSISNANPNNAVYLYQRQSSASFTTSGGSIGNTDQNGNANLTQTITFDGSSNPVLLYVVIGGLQSPTVQIPPGSCTSGCASGTLNLSQTSVSINSPSSLTVTAAQPVSITNNSNSSVANAFASGSSIIITGNSTGSTTINVCATASTSQCGSIFVSVNGGSATTLNFSNANPVVIAGQSSNITIYSPSNSNSASYYISSNSNSNVVTSPSVSGSTLYFSGGVPGNSTLNICQTAASYCGNVIVTVGSNGQGSISINPNTLTLTVGNTGTATIGNSVGALAISNNSNSSVVSASVSSYVSGQTTQTVTVYAAEAGSSTLNICPVGSSSGCVYLYVQVGSNGSTNTGGGGVSFSLPNPVMTVGQSQSIAIYSTNGINTYTISNNTSASIVSLSLSGSSLYLVGQNLGSSTITVCQTSSTICGTLYVTVNGSGGGLTFNPSNANVALNQSQTVAITGGSGSYYISSNTNPSAAAVSLQAGSLYITGLNSGTSSVTVCQSDNTSVCGVISVTVAGASSGSGTIAFSNSSPVMTVGQSQSVSINNGATGNYYISSISNPSVLTINLSGSLLNLTALSVGSSTVSICQTGGSTCANLTATVNATGSSSTPVSFISTSLPAASIGQSYNYQLQVQGGNGSYTYSISSGVLPAGLSLSNSGLVSGTPAVSSSSNVTIMAADTSGLTTAANFTIITNSAGLTAPTTAPATNPTPVAPAASGTYTNGELINENGTISIIYNHTKTPFANAAAFLGLGFSFSNVQTVSNSGLPLSPKIVVTSDGGHPRGSYLLSGSTVYFLTPNGLIPVPSWNIFLNNGGQASFIVPANSYDLNFPKLPLMTLNDPRVQN